MSNLEVILGAERSQMPGVKNNTVVKEKDAEVKEMGLMENYTLRVTGKFTVCFSDELLKLHECSVWGKKKNPRTNFSHFQPT